MMRMSLFFLGFSLCLFGCSEPEQRVSGKILGLRSGQGVSFTTSPDGSAVSLLYDNFEVRRGAADQSEEGEKLHERNFSLNADAPATARLFVRGGRIAPAGAASLTLATGGKDLDLSQQLTEENYTACADVVLKDGITAFVLKAGLHDGGKQEALMQVDSVDIEMLAPGVPKLEPGYCPPLRK